MPYDFRDNRTNYEKEKEVREKRLSAYSEDIQKRTLEQSCELIRQLVEERQRQGMTQQEVADITGILPSNLARLESGKRVPTLEKEFRHWLFYRNMPPPWENISS